MSAREVILSHRAEVARIATRHGASNVRLFGSAARGEEGPESDIDLLIDLAEDRGVRDYLALAEELEGLLQRRVDLVLARSLSPHFRRFIEIEAQPL